jgi:hypothetical protein
MPTGGLDIAQRRHRDQEWWDSIIAAVRADRLVNPPSPADDLDVRNPDERVNSELGVWGRCLYNDVGRGC